MFHEVTGIISKTGLRYEISDEWVVFSISKKGKRIILKPHNGQVRIAGERYQVYDIAKLTGLEPRSWPDDERDWEELVTTSDKLGFRYRQFKDGQVQKMDQNGNMSYQKWRKNSDGYYVVSIDGENVKVHQLMGTTRFVPKPDGMPSTWTVHHKNNNKANNHSENLEWASPETQALERRPREMHKITSCPVIGTALRDLFLADGTKVVKGEDIPFDNAYKAAASIVGGHNICISPCLNGKQNSHANFKWKTPPSDPDLNDEVFESVASNKDYERLVSTHGRSKFAFHHGYAKIVSAKDMLTERARREKDTYPVIMIKGKLKKFHRVIVETFFGPLPETIEINRRTQWLIVDHIDNEKTNARLGNLQILTQQENTQKRHLDVYKTSVASFYNKKYEYHATRINAIEYVRARGYPEATLDELNATILVMERYNKPANLYDRTWIRAHFEK